MVGGGAATFDCNDDGFPDMLLAGGEKPATFYRNASTRGGPLKFVAEKSGLELDAVTGAYPLDWGRAGETLQYRSCGCADRCWVAEVKNQRSRKTLATLRCDCERLFARRSPELAEQFRNALRAAKDRASMLDVGEAMFEEVALAAGGDRAASLREKFEQLLPLETSTVLTS